MRPRWRRALAGAIAVLAVLLVNLGYQVARKPAELFSPVAGALDKSPAETWRQYAPIFREHATPLVSAELLAALAQAEGAGNPVALTPWRFSLVTEPFEIYRPASSAVGMYQITDGTFEQARRYCIHDHASVQAGAWYDWRSCWFNALYLRVLPSDAAEMTSAFLDRNVAAILARRRLAQASARQKRDLAAAIHLCGVAAAEAFAAQGFRAAGRRCGRHDLQAYLARVESLRRVFAGMSGA